MLKSTLTRLREARMREFEGAEAADAGFTLIELMVVLLIIAILLAIAIPTFLGVTGSANDRAAQSNLTNGLTELKALYQNGQTYCPATATCATGATPLALPVPAASSRRLLSSPGRRGGQRHGWQRPQRAPGRRGQRR